MLVAFDDGDHCSFTKAALKKAADAGNYNLVAADHPLRDVGCIGGVGTWARAEDVQLGNLRGGGKRVNGIWLSEKGVIGKEKLRGF